MRRTADPIKPRFARQYFNDYQMIAGWLGEDRFEICDFYRAGSLARRLLCCRPGRCGNAGAGDGSKFHQVAARKQRVRVLAGMGVHEMTMEIILSQARTKK